MTSENKDKINKIIENLKSLSDDLTEIELSTKNYTLTQNFSLANTSLEDARDYLKNTFKEII